MSDKAEASEAVAPQRGLFVSGGPGRYRHQLAGLTKLIRNRGIAALLFEPGMGKSAVVLDYASLLALKSQSGEARVLIFCPLAAIDTWVDQAATFVSPQVDYWAEALGGSIRQKAEALASRGGMPFLRAVPKSARSRPLRVLHQELSIALGTRKGVVEIPSSLGPDALGGPSRPRLLLEIVNYDALSSRQSAGGRGSKNMADLMIEAIKRFAPDLVVADESHRIKGAMSNVSRAFARLSPLVPRRVLLTGTVMPHSPLDVYGQWRFLDPDAFGTPQGDGTVKRTSYETFKRHYGVLGGYMGRQVVAYRNLDDMQAIMARRASVARKEEALDLPRATDALVPFALSPREEAAYKDMRKALAHSFLGPDGQPRTSSVPNRLAQIMRLRQITSGFLKDDQGVIHDIGESKDSVIASLVHDTLAGERRIVIFCVFVHEIERLRARLSTSGTIVEVIHGDTDPEERLKIRHRFGSADPARIVLIAQITTLSLAVNELVTASNAIFGSLSQRRDEIVQARDRLNRIGQKLACTFWIPVASPNTIDGIIWGAYLDRTNIEDAVLAHIADGS